MPKSIKEISSFNLGTLFNISEKDAPLEAAAFSLNVNPIAENGVLDSINSHRLAVSIDKLNEVTFAYPIKWGTVGTQVSSDGSGYNGATPIYNSSTVVLENIQSVDNQAECHIRVEGIKGIRELLRMTNIEPWLEKVMISSTLPLEYIPTAAFNIEDNYIDYLTNTNAITSSLGVNVAIDGFTDNIATMEINETAPNLDTETFTLTTPDGTIKEYLYTDNTGTTGTLDGTKVEIFIPNGTYDTEAEIAAETKLAIEHPNGHNGKISVVQTDGQVEGVADLTPTTGEGNLSAAWAINADYQDIKQKSTSGSGDGCIIDIETEGSGLPTVTITDKGAGYADTDTIVFNEPDLSAEIITNGTMEVNDNWSNTTSAPAANYQTEEQVYAGTYSRKFRPDGVNEGIISDAFTTVVNIAYSVSAWVYPTYYTTVTLKLLEGDGSTVQESNKTGLNTNEWNYIEETFIDASGGTGAKVQIDSGDKSDGSWYIDAVSVKGQNTLTLTVNDISSKLDLTDEHGSLERYLEEGDYLTFRPTADSSITATTDEFLQIEDIDRSINRMFLKRRCFGSQSIFPLVASTAYGIFANKLTTNNVQLRTTRGVAKLYDWSNYAGNHIGGNGTYYRKTAGTDSWNRYVGVINAEDYNVTFSNANKTITFSSTESLESFTEQDTITIWGNNTLILNGGKSFKILKIDGAVAHVDVAPTTETISDAGRYIYIETNLLKNHTFHHSVATVDETASVIGADKSRKVNQWEHYTASNNVPVLSTGTEVAHVSSGGYWEDTTAGHGDLATKYYPCDADDAYISIQSKFDSAGSFQIKNTTSISEEDTHLLVTAGATPKTYDTFSANDIILIDNEYMRVTGVEGINMYVQRAVMGATGPGELNAAATHNFDAAVTLCHNECIRQVVPNSRLDKKQAYNITFFAKALDYNGELIDEEYNRTFEEATGVDWAAYHGSASIDEDGNVPNKLEVTTDTTNVPQGAILSYTHIDNAGDNPLALDKVYQVNMDLRQVTSTDTFSGDYTLSIGGVHTVIGPLTNQEQTYTVTATCTSATGSLVIRNTSATATVFTIDNVSVKEVIYPEGALSLRFGPGYFGHDGIWKQNSNATDLGMANGIAQQEARWIDFEELNMPDGDGAEDGNSLDSTWRKFSKVFYMPLDVEFTDSNANLIVEFASRGTHGSKIGVDLVDLREHPIGLIKKYNMIAPSSSGFINNSGIQDLVIYDKEDSNLNIIPGFKLNQSALLRPTEDINKSLYASERTQSGSGDVTYIAKNRETHIGFGSGAEDSPPQWLGYVNSKVFDEDSTNELYQDEDTIHSYDAGSTTTLSKVCVAGEHEHLISYWNNSGGTITDNSVGTEDLLDNTLRIHHAAHSMNIGDNIVAREWEDVSNSWDGRGVWVIIAIQTDYFDCKRFNTLDLDPLEEGIMTTTSTSYSAPDVTVNTDGVHGLTTGDNVLIYGGTNDTDVNGVQGPVTYVDTNTYTFSDTDSASIGDDTDVVTVKQFRLCYRPYYYYGIKEGDSAIYRISPDTLIDANGGTPALDTSGDYVKGTIERSIETTKVLGSIATCYNKKADGTGGGMIYVLSSDATDYKDTKITAIDVQIAFDKWTIDKVDEVCTFVPRFRAFKWSNDSTNGNINTGAPESTTAHTGTVKVFGSIASSSSPFVKAAGIPSDIIETKGPNHTYDSKATTNTTNNPTMFDTRLWLQFRPGGNESFSEGDRFLFAARTIDWHFAGGDRRLYLADRTPPTTTVFGKEVRYGMGNEKFRSGPGVHPKDGDNDNKHKKLSDKILKKYSYYWYKLGKKGEGRDYLKRISPIRNGTGKYWDNSIISADLGKHPYFHFGYNVGWDGNGGKFPAIKVPKYGLVPMLDNDHDGIIDGTGLVVPSLKTLPDQVNGIRMGPYGNYHQRVCAHAVGLVAKSNRPWVRHWGKLMDFADASHFVSGNTRNDKWPHHMDAPENMKADKMLMISSDVHYGDFQPRWEYVSSSLSSYNNSIIDGYSACVKIKTISYGSSNNIGRTMQGGDMVYLHGEGYNKSCHITRVLTSTEVVLSLKYDYEPNGVYKLYPFTREPYYIRSWGLAKHGLLFTALPHDNAGNGYKYKSFHWAFDDKNPKKGDRFYKKNQAAGHFVKNWWTAPTSFGFAYNSPASSKIQAPGIVNRIEKLNFRAGCMIRPFDKNTSTFTGLKADNGTVVSIASAPDAVYHQKNGAYIHYNVGTTTDALSNNIKHNSKLHIADDASGTKYSKLFLADTSFMFPDKKHSWEVKKTTSNEKTHGFNDYPLYKPLFAGKISSYYSISTGSKPNAGNCPVVEVTGNSSSEIYYNRTLKGQYLKRGVWVGASISIRDQVTGIIQTRQIVESSSSSSYTYLHVHYPFAHKPLVNDEFWVWKHAYVCTAPLKLYKETSLGLGLGKAYFENGLAGDGYYNDKTPFLHRYKIAETEAHGTYAEMVVDGIHHIGPGDKIKVSGTDLYDGIYENLFSIGKYNPRLVRFPSSAPSTQEDEPVRTPQTGAYVSRITNDTENTHSNHIKLELDRPLIHTMFGGLDLRKSFSYTLNAAPVCADSKNTFTTSINHNIQVGDTVQLNMDVDAGKDGSFDIEDTPAADTIRVINSDSSDTANHGNGIAHNIWWQSLIASQTGSSKLGEISHGLYSWARGKEVGNIVREDRATADDEDIYMSTGQTVINIQASSSANRAGYFKANNIYRYKISLIYDGYQEGLLSSGTWEYLDTSGRDSLDITLQIKEYSKRLTHFCIYRKDTKNALYKLVKEVRTDTGWEYDDEKWSFEFEDEGDLGATYEARVGLSEILDTIQVKYGMSAELDGYLFVGNCSHDKIENAENLIFRSKPGRFSTFDYVNDFLQLKSKPTAMANFLGRLFVFDNTNIYKINQETLAIEDIFEGIGCIGKDSITVTEHGMFFADRNGAYVHNGTVPQKISDTIFKSGDTDTPFGGTDNIKDISWSNTGGNELARPPYVVYDSIVESVLFFVEYLDKEIGSGGEIKHLKHNYIWSYNIKKNRWDLWELDKDSVLGVPFSGNKGQILVPVDNGIYEVRGSGKKMDYTWMSKKLKLEGDSILKVYNKIKINGIEDNINLGGSNTESSDRLLIHTNAGEVDTSDVIYRSKDTGNSTYKLSGQNRKGRWMQFKLEDMREPIDSIGIIYRLRAVK